MGVCDQQANHVVINITGLQLTTITPTYFSSIRARLPEETPWSDHKNPFCVDD